MREEGITLWLCVGSKEAPDGPVAVWSKVLLGEPVEGDE